MHQGMVIKGFNYVYYAFRNSFLTVIIPLSNYINVHVLGTEVPYQYRFKKLLALQVDACIWRWSELVFFIRYPVNWNVTHISRVRHGIYFKCNSLFAGFLKYVDESECSGTMLYIQWTALNYPAEFCTQKYTLHLDTRISNGYLIPVSRKSPLVENHGFDFN